MTIVYIPGEDNTVADALSHVLDGAFPGETIAEDTTPHGGIHATLTITTDTSILRQIQDGYHCDEFCKKLTPPSA
jgi:hypothetical protein